jgi:hypothetical protein
MLAFRIEVDGQPPLIAGVEDWSVLALHVNAIRGEAHQREADELVCSVGGLTMKNPEGISHHFRWSRIPLKLGSTVKVSIVEAETSNPPVRRYCSGSEMQENPFTEEEQREMRRQDYLALKKEFEGDKGK